MQRIRPLCEPELHGADDVAGGARDEQDTCAGGDVRQHPAPVGCDDAFVEREHEADRGAAFDGIAEQRAKAGKIGGTGRQRERFDGMDHDLWERGRLARIQSRAGEPPMLPVQSCRRASSPSVRSAVSTLSLHGRPQFMRRQFR